MVDNKTLVQLKNRVSQNTNSITTFTCHICGSTGLQFTFKGPLEKFTRASGRSEGVDYYYCSICTGLSQHPIFTSPQYTQFYERTQRSEAVGYNSRKIPAKHLLRKRQDAEFKWKLMDNINLFPLLPGCRVYEIGCGEGTLLKRFQDIGYDVRGIEPLELYAEYARTVLGLNILTSFFSPGLEPANSADLIEH